MEHDSLSNVEIKQEITDTFQGVQEDKPFGCSECHKRFTRKGDMYRHLRIHTGEKPFSCPECADDFTRKDDMIRHLRTHTGVKPYCCTSCDRKFSRRSDLFKHTMTHSKAKYEDHSFCLIPDCQETDHNHNQVQVPTVQKRGRPKSSKECTLHKCNICSKTFKHKRDLTRHIRIHSCMETSNVSVSNDGMVTNKENESQHQNIQVIQVVQDGDEQKPCDNILALNVSELPSSSECKYVVIMDDTENGMGAEAIQLLINDPSFHNVLLGNTDNKNDKKPFHCPECGDQFGRKSDMTRHLQIHSGSKPFTCEVCGRPFNRKGDMNRHALTHSGIKPYCCSICGKCFTRKTDFEVHSAVHSMEVCPVECQSEISQTV